MNPADDVSRGLKQQKFIDQYRWWKGPEYRWWKGPEYRWWKGPEYLWKSEENSPNAEIGEVSQDDPEFRNEVEAHLMKSLTLVLSQKLHA